MTLDETIKYYEEKAELYESSAKSKEYYNINAAHADREYANDFKQLSEWLTEFKNLKEEVVLKEKIEEAIKLIERTKWTKGTLTAICVNDAISEAVRIIKGVCDEEKG